MKGQPGGSMGESVETKKKRTIVFKLVSKARAYDGVLLFTAQEHDGSAIPTFLAGPRWRLTQ